MKFFLKCITIPLFLFLLCLGCSKETIDPNLTGSIQGIVRNAETGEPVSLAGVTTNPGTDALLTDQNGQFAISEVPTGNYSIQVSKNDYVSRSVRISVNENRTANAQILLVPDSSGRLSSNLNAEITFIENVTFSNEAGIDSNYVDVEYMLENPSSTNRVSNYEVYFQIHTSANSFYYEASGDSLAVNERTFGSFTKYIRDLRADSVTISGVYIAS